MDKGRVGRESLRHLVMARLAMVMEWSQDERSRQGQRITNETKKILQHHHDDTHTITIRRARQPTRTGIGELEMRSIIYCRCGCYKTLTWTTWTC